jgi:hypothetical protein
LRPSRHRKFSKLREHHFARYDEDIDRLNLAA